MTLEENIRELRESLIVTSAQTLRHETRLKEHQQWLEDNEMAYARHRIAMAELDARTIQHERNMERIELALERVDLGLAEATEKLNALIDIVDGRRRSS